MLDPSIEQSYASERFREMGHRLIDFLADQLEQSLSGNGAQAIPWIEPTDSLQLWEQALSSGMTMEQFAETLVANSVRISDPKFLGHQICTPAPTTILAGLLTDFLNNGSGVYEMGMSGNSMEKLVIRTVAKQLGMPESADGIMTSGGTLANLTAMLAARSVKSEQADWTDGTHNQLAVMVSDQAHYCIDRAVRIMGWGSQGIILVPTNEDYRMQTSHLPGLLAEAQQQGKQVIGVVGSACSTSTGSFDNLEEIGSFCRFNDLWFHVDGAHGAAVSFSEKHRHLVKGIEWADSVAIDFHKMMMTPVLSSAVIYRNQQHSFSPFAVEADYLFARQDGEQQTLDEYNLAKRTFECTKTMLSAKVFSLLAIHGTELLAANVDRLQELTAIFTEMLQQDPRFELALVPQCNIVCFRFVETNRTQDELSKLNREIRERLIRKGEFYIVQTVLQEETWLRCTVANPFTSSQELSALLDEIAQHAATIESIPSG